MLLAALIGASEAARPTVEVLVLHTADTAPVEELRSRFARTGLLRDTDPWDLDADGVPTVEDLLAYDAVLLWLEAPPAEPARLGDALADFVDAEGGGLVLAGPTCAIDRSPGGRLATEALLPWVPGLLASSDGERALVSGPDHDLHGALGVIDAQISPRCEALVPSGPVPLIWDDAAPLVALHPTRRVAGVNLWPPDDSSDPAGWGTDGHGDQLLVRALLWSSGWGWPAEACRRQTSEADQNCNGILRSDELLVDMLDPECSGQLGPDGLPLPSLDDYVEPGIYGCRLPVTTRFDQDGDGLGGGVVQVWVEELLWGEWNLACDGCPDDFDPLRFDLDCDTIGDLCDSCPFDAGSTIDDDDEDGIVDACDNCRLTANPTQDDEDGDQRGNACDVCPDDPDPGQADTDLDGIGDVCDPCPFLKGDAADTDGDGVGDRCDLCPNVSDVDQSDVDRDGWGDVCDVCPLDDAAQIDTDQDGVGDACDTCPELAAASQVDADQDGVGDACDPCPRIRAERPGDLDGDGVPDVCDLCIRTPNPHQLDSDGDGVGNACDVCPHDPDRRQRDGDEDGKGDVCDDVSIRGGGGLCSATGGCGGFLGTVLAWVGSRRRRADGVRDRLAAV